MLNFTYVEDTPESPNKGKEVSMAGTVVEVPPITVYGVRAYRKTPYGKKLIGDFFTKDQALLKKVHVKSGKPIDEIDSVANEIAELRALALTNPSLTTTGKKTPECVELGVGGGDIKRKIEYVKGLVGKQVNVSDVFEKGAYVDVVAVTKAKGWQGPVKRYGVSIQRRKATGKRRHVGNLGSWHPAIVEYTALQAGQMGYHKRTVLNNLIVDIGDGDKLRQDGGLLHYGKVKTKYVVIKGSLPGTKKRLIKLRRALRKPAAKRELKVTYFSRAM